MYEMGNATGASKDYLLTLHKLHPTTGVVEANELLGLFFPFFGRPAYTTTNQSPALPLSADQHQRTRASLNKLLVLSFPTFIILFQYHFSPLKYTIWRSRSLPAVAINMSMPQ